MKKHTLVLVLSLTLIFGIVAGGTFAWLQDKTDPVENVFTVGDINIELDESDDLDLKILPGKTITKDPVVTVEGGSEDCWLFVEITEANWSEKLTYAIAAGWTKLEDGVYYREVAARSADQEFPVLASNHVLASSELTKAELEAMQSAQPKLTFTAYAVQKDGVSTAADAWAIAKPANP